MCKDRKPKDGVLRLPDVTGGDMRRSKQKSVGRSSQKGRKKARREGGERERETQGAPGQVPHV